jgi:tRNA-2-methylthio-N6-dimethylallyladenosine synthase
LTQPFQIVDIAEEAGSESTIKDHLVLPPVKTDSVTRRSGNNGNGNGHDTKGAPAVTAFVSIMQGCDMHCTFCIVPYTRGTERSRPIPAIVEEVRRLADHGVREVTLLGQIVTSYGRKDSGKSAFANLLAAVNDVPGIERIRFTSPHPKGFGDDLVAAYRELPKLCEHAHLPAQSGSNRVLKAMNRGYTRESYLRIIEKLRAARPGIALTTDLIVGFPGETEAEFEETCELVREVDFDQGFIFKYSTRRDTPAASLPGQLPEAVKEERNQRLLQLINAAALRKHQALVGTTVEILVEGRSQKGAKRMTGRTRTNKIVLFDGTERHCGQLLPVRIERATTITLYGDPAIHNL